MTETLTHAIGTFLSDVARHGVPAAARDAALPGFIDAVGCMIAGAHEDAVQIAITAFSPLPPGPSQICFSDTCTSAQEAALINGIASHILDYDDTCLRGHPSAVLVPAVLALGQELGRSGAQVLDAYVAGYEVWAELVDREAGFHQTKGWHPTGIFGHIAAAAACAVLYKLDPEHSRYAVGLGASQASGLMSNFGAMSKSFHVGRAAQSGVLAARLASLGFSASTDALEHPKGFLAAVSPAGDVNLTQPPTGLGTEWQIVHRKVNLKKYPTCYYTHRALDAILALISEHAISASAVDRITVTLSQEHALALRNSAPKTALAAKFSMQFAMACALVAGKVGLNELRNDVVMRSDIQQLMDRVSISIDTRYDPQTPGAACQDTVTLQLRDGRSLAKSIRRATGHAQLPLSAAERKAKFMDCLAYGKFLGDAHQIYARLLGIAERSTV